jgi:hypothetical protein
MMRKLQIAQNFKFWTNVRGMGFTLFFKLPDLFSDGPDRETGHFTVVVFSDYVNFRQNGVT